MRRPRKRVVDVGFPLVVREWGEVGSPVVYWPGLNPFGALALNEAGPEWAEAYGLRVVSVSAPGMGESPSLPAPEYRLPRLAGLVVRLLDELGFERAAFVGFSWGASLGCHLAALSPDRLNALVLLDAGYDDVPGGRTLEERISAAHEGDAANRFPDWDAFFAAARERRPRWRPALEESLRAGMREQDGAIAAAADPDAVAAAFWGVAEDPPSAQLPAIGSIDLPVLLLVSSERGDPEVGASAVDRFRQTVPQAEVQRIADSGHDLLADQPELTIGAVGEFLARVDSSS